MLYYSINNREKAMTDALKKAAWIAWGNDVTKQMEEFIQTWDLKSARSFKMGQVKFDWSPRRRRSYGGLYKIDNVWQPGISIAMTNYTRSQDNIYRWYEYKSFDESPVIGGFYSDNLADRVRAVIAHEMAHAIQHWHQWSCKLPKTKPHGDEFKYYYQILREEFVNGRLPDQTKMGAEYRKLRNVAITQELGPLRRAAC